MSCIAVYAGSFDPPTFGHLDCIERAARIFSEVVVVLAVNPRRTAVLGVDERVALLRELCQPFTNVRVDAHSGLVVEFARSVGARVLVRGVRSQTDFDYEVQIASANADLAPDLETVFFPSRAEKSFISASLVREIASHGADVSKYAPAAVCAALKRVYPKPGA